MSRQICKIAALTAMVLVAGCEQTVVSSNQHASVISASNASLTVFRDRVNGVTCWSKGEASNTLSCLPDWMLDNQAAMIFDREVKP